MIANGTEMKCVCGELLPVLDKGILISRRACGCDRHYVWHRNRQHWRLCCSDCLGLGKKYGELVFDTEFCEKCNGSGLSKYNGFKDPCEYNPSEKRAAWDHEVHANAEFIVGQDGKWRLCASCADLAEFRKYKVRRPIKRSI